MYISFLLLHSSLSINQCKPYDWHNSGSYYYCLKMPVEQTTPDSPSPLPEPTCPYTLYLFFITQKHELRRT